MSDRKKEIYIDMLTGWLIPEYIPEVAKAALASTALDGVYTGKSHRIMRLVQIAYLRGVRRGAALAYGDRR